MRLTPVLEAGYQIGDQPVTADKDMTEQFVAKAAEIRAMFCNLLEPKGMA